MSGEINCLVDHGNAVCNCFKSTEQSYSKVCIGCVKLQSRIQELEEELAKCRDWNTKDLWLKEIAELKSELAVAIELIQNIHDICFDGDGLETAKELGQDVASLAKSFLSRHAQQGGNDGK